MTSKENINEYGVLNKIKSLNNLGLIDKKSNKISSFVDINRIKRKSQVKEIDFMKTKFINLLGTKFKLVYKIVKKFVILNGLSEIE